MTFHINEHLPTGFAPASRVWIYQSNRPFSEADSIEIENLLQQFANQWLSHGDKVTGFAKVFFNHFIILVADETLATVSGCSTDSSVRLIKEIEHRFNVDLFNRQNLAFLVEDKVQIVPLPHLNNALHENVITLESIYFNNLVNYHDLLHNWMVPMRESWLMKKIKPVIVE